MSKSSLRKSVLVGAVLGGILTLGIALSMDLFLGDTLQGTWRDAAAKDVTKMFGPDCGQNSVAVMSMLILVMGFLGGFGAMIGAVAGLIINRFFKMLLKP